MEKETAKKYNEAELETSQHQPLSSGGKIWISPFLSTLDEFDSSILPDDRISKNSDY